MVYSGSDLPNHEWKSREETKEEGKTNTRMLSNLSLVQMKDGWPTFPRGLWNTPKDSLPRGKRGKYLLISNHPLYPHPQSRASLGHAFSDYIFLSGSSWSFQGHLQQNPKGKSIRLQLHKASQNWSVQQQLGKRWSPQGFSMIHKSICIYFLS